MQTLAKFFLFTSFFLTNLFAEPFEELPKFVLKDQNGISHSYKSCLGKNCFIMNCSSDSIVVCRKLGRKVYYKMLNRFFHDSDQPEFFLIVDTSTLFSGWKVWLSDKRKSGYERVLLDEKAEFSKLVSKDSLKISIGDQKYLPIFQKDYKEIGDSDLEQMEKTIRSNRK